MYVCVYRGVRFSLALLPANPLHSLQNERYIETSIDVWNCRSFVYKPSVVIETYNYRMILERIILWKGGYLVNFNKSLINRFNISGGYRVDIGPRKRNQYFSKNVWEKLKFFFFFYDKKTEYNRARLNFLFLLQFLFNFPRVFWEMIKWNRGGITFLRSRTYSCLDLIQQFDRNTFQFGILLNEKFTGRYGMC